MIDSIPILSLVIWFPILGGILLMVVAGDKSPDLARKMALAISVLTFIFAIPLYTSFDIESVDMQFQEKYAWIALFDIYYHIGIDGISLPLILLTTFTTVLTVIAGWEVIKDKVAHYMAAFLIQEGLMIGAFSALDGILFYVFWEAILIPMFLIIGIWGGPNRIYATIKFFLYTFMGSVFMLVALLYLGHQADSFSILDFHEVPLELTPQILIFIAFLLAFAVKVPMWPVHTWLPDAHVEAPTGGSVVLAAVMLKLGGYGFLRFSLPITPDASLALDTFMIVLSLIAIVYIGFVALVQPDMKRLIAYSSVSHMGFVTLGIFICFGIMEADKTDVAVMGISGAVVQMISHGFISGALFFCVGVMYDRVHSRMIGDYGGVVNTMPVFAAFMLLFAMANSGLPGTSGFVGEFMIILASFEFSIWVAFLAALTLIVGAAYTLWMYKRVIYGAIANKNVEKLEDSTPRERLILAAFAAAVLIFGLWPAPMIEVITPSVGNLLEHVMQTKLVP